MPSGPSLGQIDYWSPTINMQRDPRWGRNQEVPGEDPMLTGAYASAFVRGLQGGDAKHLQITACCKHFVANSLESESKPKLSPGRKQLTCAPAN